MRIVIFGPTGGTGKLLTDQALRRGHAVTAFARDITPIAPRHGLLRLAGSVLDASEVDAAIQGHDVVLSALGGRPWRKNPICAPAISNAITAMTKHGVRRLIVMSTHGAGDTRADVDWFTRNVIIRFILAKEVADKEAMEKLLSASDLDWTVVRVGRLTNEPLRNDFRVADDGSIKGMGKIGRADVASFMLNQIESEKWLRRKPVIVY